VTSVSAVIPVHNGQDYVAEAVRSVLSQTRPVRECIVVDDGSTDGTPEVLERFGDSIRVISQSQSGVSAARNRGAREAQGDLVAFLDHDDVWLAAKLELQLASMSSEHTMVVCALQVVDAGGAPIEIKRLDPIERLVHGMLLFDGVSAPSCSSTGVVQRDRFLAMGGFDPALSMSADWDLLLRVLLEGRLAYLDEPLVRYRVHGSNMSRHIDVMERDMRQAFGKAFAHPALPASIQGRRSQAYGRLYRMLAGSYQDVGEQRHALRALSMSLRHDPRLIAELARRGPALMLRRRSRTKR
jgi:glycosyltransferase involved in cell wall biosynthesis